MIAVGCLLAAAVAASGCSRRPKTVRVTGVVTYQGKPVKDAAVLFAPEKGRPATGVTDENGRFRLMTFVPGDGAVPGEYTVAIDAHESLGPKKNGETGEDLGPPGKVRWIVPEKYSQLDKSGLRVTVASGQPEIRFDLK